MAITIKYYLHGDIVATRGPYPDLDTARACFADWSRLVGTDNVVLMDTDTVVEHLYEKTL